MAKPDYKTLLAYARKAVRSEVSAPLHGRLSGYEQQAVMNDVLNHFDGLDVDDEDIIHDAVVEAQAKYNEEHGGEL